MLRTFLSVLKVVDIFEIYTHTHTLDRAARARHMLAMEKKIVIKVNSKFYLYHKTKI